MRIENYLVRSALVAALLVALPAGPVAGAQKKGPLKVYILAGQSNMDGQADISTIDFLSEDPDPAKAALLKKFKPDGKTPVARDDVWVTSGDVCGKLSPGYGGRKDYSKLGHCIGPEYAFGYFMGEASENQVLLIKYAPGGQSLYKDFRPPSAGLPDPMPLKTVIGADKVKSKVPMTAEDFGGQYRGMIAHVRDVLKNLKTRFPSYDEKAGYEISGFVWFQGFNDLVDGHRAIDEYARNLVCLIKDARKEFKAPQMKVVVGVIGVNGVGNETGKQKALRDAQRSMNTVPEFQGNVKAIESAPLLDPRIVALKTAGWLNQDRDLKQNPLTDKEKALLGCATSNWGFHYYGEGRFFILLGKAMAETMQALMGTHASEPNGKELGAAIGSGDFAAYFKNISAWLANKTPADPSSISKAAMTALLKDPVFRNALDQRQLLAKIGAANLGAFASADPRNKEFLGWLLPNTAAMDLYLEAAVPTGLNAREANNYGLGTSSLEIWKRIYFADADSREGLYLRLAIATALAPPGSGNRGAGMAKTPGDPLARYLHFKTAHKNKELFPSFDDLTVWEYTKIVSSCASDADLAWAREMIDTWRPDLRIKEQVVNSTSEVWRRNSPHPYTDYKAVLSGGGKCGPRSSWSVMVCQAFGIPAIGVGQPQHACVAYKVADPSVEPQPGSAWKVGYGRGWQWSHLEGMSGHEFLSGVEQRSRVDQFSQVEHLRWLASALASKDQAAAVMDVARHVQQSVAAVKTDLTASAKAAEADKEVAPEVKAASATSQEPLKLSPAARVEAAAFSSMSGVSVNDCYTGGKQVNFQKSVKESWVDYTLDVPATGVYALQLKLATPNFGQILDISAGSEKLATIEVPNTTGLWAVTRAVDVNLEQGRRTLRISAPFQRGVAVRWFELKAK